MRTSTSIWIPLKIQEEDNHLDPSDRKWWKWVLIALVSLPFLPILAFMAGSWWGALLGLLASLITSFTLRYIVQRTG
jgi:thiamine transporter ThiT